MPIYEYRCKQCGHQDSDMDSINAPRVKKCPQCGKRSFSRLISAAAFHLKGGGWYATDFKDKGKKPAEKDKTGKDEKGGKESKDGKTEKDGKKADSAKTEKTEKSKSENKSENKPAKSGGGKKTKD